MENIASLTDPDFGKEMGLLHEVCITGRKVGATKEFFSSLAHDQEKFRKALDAVYNGETFTIRARPFSVEERLRKYKPFASSDAAKVLRRFRSMMIPEEDFSVTLVGGVPYHSTLSQVPAYLHLRGYRPLTLAEGMLLVESEKFLHRSIRQRHFATLETPTCGEDGTGVFFPVVGGAHPHDTFDLFFALWDGSNLCGRNDFPAIKLKP